MKTRIALVGIIVEVPEAVEKLNRILHEYREFVIGRMGLPQHRRNLSIISVVLDAPESIISALAGKLGMLEGLTVKTVYSKYSDPEEANSNQ